MTGSAPPHDRIAKTFRLKSTAEDFNPLSSWRFRATRERLRCTARNSRLSAEAGNSLRVACLSLQRRNRHALCRQPPEENRIETVTSFCRSVTMDQRVLKVIALMKETLHRGWSAGRLAKCVNLSPSRLHQVFKEETGLPPARYLRLLRMQQARELLETSHLSVKLTLTRPRRGANRARRGKPNIPPAPVLPHGRGADPPRVASSRWCYSVGRRTEKL